MTKVNEFLCPHCGCKMNMHTSATNDVAPRPGDFSVCFECTAITVIKEDLTVRKATETDLENIDEEHLLQINRVRRAILDIKNETNYEKKSNM